MTAPRASRTSPPSHRDGSGLIGRGLIAGLLAAALAVAVGQLVASLAGQPDGSPVVAVGSLAIDYTPPAVKDFAISAFGTHDKLVLVSGILVLMAGYAAWVGRVAVRRFTSGVQGIGLFAAIGLLSAMTRPGASVATAVPTLVAAGAAIFALHRMVLAARAAAAPVISPGPGRTPPDRDPRPDRRRFIVTSSAVAGAAAVAGLAGRQLTANSSVSRARAVLRVPAPARPAPPLPPGTDFRIPGLTPFVTPNQRFYRVDTAIVLPQVAPSSWSLRIHGMVERELKISFSELLRRPLIEDWITLTCVSDPVQGPYVGNAKWLGASLPSLLRQAGVRAGADQLVATSADGFTSGTPLQAVLDGREALLAIAMNGQPLPVAHGFPVRMVIPGLYGYVSACKWIVDLEVTTFAANHAYWTTRGWDQQAPIKTESRIDIPGGGTQRPGQVTVAGVAWAQHKGIEAVEARVGNGPWHQARLATVPGIDTWRQWAWDWDATPGQHVIQARATDKTGYTQTALAAPPPPNGASGYPAIQVTVGGS